MNPFPGPSIPVPVVTAQQMLEVDRVMEEDLGIGLVQMMENAGRGLARLCVERFLGGDPREEAPGREPGPTVGTRRHHR